SMLIKIKCVCGSVYSFEDTPVNGRMQFPVSCVNCGADGTEKANAYVAAQLSGKSVAVGPSSAKKLSFGFLKKKNSEADLDETVAAPAPKGSIPEPADGDSPQRLALAIAGALAVGAVGALGWLYLAKATGFEFGYVAWALGGMVGVTARALAPSG